MKKLLVLLTLAFFVRVKVPFGVDLTYHNVQSVTLGAYGTYWDLVLDDGRKAIVPAFWTAIEEEKEKK